MSALSGCLLAFAALALYDLAASTSFAGRRLGSLTRRSDGAVRSPLAWLLVAGVRLYRVGWSGGNAGVCRFEPSCSSYALDALRKFGGVRGGGLAVYRLARCQPLSAGGFDPVPTRRADRADHADQPADVAPSAGPTKRPSAAQPVAVYPVDPMNSADQTADAERRLGTRA